MLPTRLSTKPVTASARSVVQIDNQHARNQLVSSVSIRVAIIYADAYGKLACVDKEEAAGAVGVLGFLRPAALS